jgi:RimJ/RimL family protein N-acetyltransferase
MTFNERLRGNSVTLRSITLEDCNNKYLSWLRDEDVNKYLETRWQEQSIDMIREFVNKQINSNDSYLFAIVIENPLENENHIGNIKIGPINERYNYADISYFIGEKLYWGKGVATESIRLIVDFAFNVLKLRRCNAGVFEKNKSSIRALEKNGFMLEGNLRKELINIYGEREDHLLYGILYEEWLKQRGIR